MSQQELLKQVVDVLEQSGVDYMVTGSTVSSLQGEPRVTHDIDFVVTLTVASAKPLIEAFPPPRYYVDEHSIRSAVSTQGMFNLIDVDEGDKVDFWILKNDPYDQSAFSRRYREEAVGIRFFVSRPEDTILSKLRWSEMCGGSEKQLRDALRVYEVQYSQLDLKYLDDWANQLNVESVLQDLKKQAQVL